MLAFGFKAVAVIKTPNIWKKIKCSLMHKFVFNNEKLHVYCTRDIKEDEGRKMS
jgi:hypothetical protein